MLFDHGCDMITTFMIVVFGMSVLRIQFENNSILGIILILNLFVPLFFQMVEVYFFRRLDLPKINGSSEGILVSCSLCILSAIYGNLPA